MKFRQINQINFLIFSKIVQNNGKFYYCKSHRKTNVPKFSTKTVLLVIDINTTLPIGKEEYCPLFQ